MLSSMIVCVYFAAPLTQWYKLFPKMNIFYHNHNNCNYLSLSNSHHVFNVSKLQSTLEGIIPKAWVLNKTKSCQLERYHQLNQEVLSLCSYFPFNLTLRLAAVRKGKGKERMDIVFFVMFRTINEKCKEREELRLMS